MATDVDVTAQAEIVLGGRGLESIDTVTHYPDRDAYTLSIDTGRGSKQVLKLDMQDNELRATGDTRVHPFLNIQLSENGATKLKRAIKDAFEITEKELR
jgi:hypothetical protein